MGDVVLHDAAGSVIGQRGGTRSMLTCCPDLVAPSSDSFRALRLARSLNDHLLALPLADKNERMTRLLDQSYGCYIFRNCCDIDRRHGVYREGS